MTTPPPYAAAPPPEAPRPSGSLGETRSIGMSILWAVLTFGIYTFYWTWKTHEEVKVRCGQGVGGWVGVLLYLVFSPITYFLLAHEVEVMLQGDGRQSRVSTITGLWLLLPLVGSIVWFVKVQGQLNDYWRSLGAT